MSKPLLSHWLYTKSLKDINQYFKNKAENNKALAARKILIDNYFSNNEIKKLQLGSGPFPMEGWLNTDLRHNQNTAWMNAAETYPFTNESFDYIFTEHLFEHLTFEQESIMLQQSFRVLKKGGKIRIATPDLAFLIKLYNPSTQIEKDYVNWSINRYYSLKPMKAAFEEKDFNKVFVINNFFSDWGHQIIHDFSSLELMLKKAGFASVSLQKVGISSDPHLNGIEKHGNQISDTYNLLETIVVEAIK